MFSMRGNINIQGGKIFDTISRFRNIDQYQAQYIEIEKSYDGCVELVFDGARKLWKSHLLKRLFEVQKTRCRALEDSLKISC